ncbi:MAG: phage tail assembly chaperone [Paraprevotella sp.]|nr:phage tail assembly chaperone [Paraprevotella sp.]
MTLLYLYDEYNVFTGETEEANIDPIDGSVLEKVYATAAKPLEKKEGFAVVFNQKDRKWEYVPDYRGTGWFYRADDGTIQEQWIHPVTGLGEVPMPNTYASRDEVPKTDKEMEAVVRSQRNALLQEADILINKAIDADEDISALSAYRQALRDVPQQEGFPHNVVWPELPQS